MKEGWTQGLSKICPKCSVANRPYFGRVLACNDIILDYRCSECGHEYVRRDKAPEATVEPLDNFRRPRDDWFKPKRGPP